MQFINFIIEYIMDKLIHPELGNEYYCYKCNKKEKIKIKGKFKNENENFSKKSMV